jgi:hypothetical protein
MADTALLPATIQAGDTLDTTVALPAYPASAGWVLHHRLVPRAAPGTVIDLVATAAGADHRVQASATTTAGWGAGVYTCVSWVVQGAQRVTLARSELQLLADLAAATAPADTRTQAQRALDDALAALAAWTPTTRRYTVGDRQMEFNSVADIQAVVAFWRVEVRREDTAARVAAGQARPATRTTVRLQR